MAMRNMTLGLFKYGIGRVREYIIWFQTLIIFDLWTRNQPYVSWWLIWVLAPIGAYVIYYFDKKRVQPYEFEILNKRNPEWVRLMRRLDDIEQMICDKDDKS